MENRYGMDGSIGRDFIIVACDIDYFKQVNDRFEHQAGDAVLIFIATTCLLYRTPAITRNVAQAVKGF